MALISEYGIKRTEDGGMFCEKCGADLTQPNSSRFAYHADGRTCYKNGFVCVSCGAPLMQEYAREDYERWD